MIPGFKTVSMRDIIMQPGSNTMGPPMPNPMVCHILEGEMRLVAATHSFRPRRQPPDGLFAFRGTLTATRVYGLPRRFADRKRTLQIPPRPKSR
jgi:hypothetical protein